MSLRRRVLLGCLVVAAVLLATDAVLASTFRSFLLGRVDQQVIQAADPLIHGRFRGGFPGARLGTTTPTTAPAPTGTGEQRLYTEYYIGVAAADGTVSRLGPGLRENDLSAPKLSPGDLADHLSPSADDLRLFTVPSSTGGGEWRVVVVKRTNGEDGTVIFGARLNDMDATFARMLTVEGVATVLVLAALGAMALWVLRLGVRPLAHMAETAGHIAAGDLSQRVEHADDRTEAGQLGTASSSRRFKTEIKPMRPAGLNLPKPSVPAEAIEYEHQRIVNSVLNVRLARYGLAGRMGVKRADDLLSQNLHPRCNPTHIRTR